MSGREYAKFGSVILKVPARMIVNNKLKPTTTRKLKRSTVAKGHGTAIKLEPENGRKKAEIVNSGDVEKKTRKVTKKKAPVVKKRKTVEKKTPTVKRKSVVKKETMENIDQVIRDSNKFDLVDAAKVVLAKHGKNAKFRTYEWVKNQFIDGAFKEHKEELVRQLKNNDDVDELNMLIRKNTIAKIGEVINKVLSKTGRSFSVKNITKNNLYLNLLSPQFKSFIEAIKENLRK